MDNGFLNRDRKVKASLVAGDGRRPYYRATMPTLSGLGQIVDVPAGPYKAITLGPRHTLGPIAVVSKEFGGSPDPDAAVTNIPSVLISARSAWLGYVGEFPLQVYVPQTGASLFAMSRFNPTMDLLFWYEFPPVPTTRPDASLIFSVVTGTPVFVPLGARRQINTLIRAIGGNLNMLVEGVSYSGPNQSGGWIYANRRTLGTFATTVAQPTVLSWGDSGLIAPPTPLTGENGFIPDGLIFTESSANTASVQVNTQD